ncbi:MAG: hypothetical protein ACREIV_00040, partial [Planctomycetaceae bacterium]
MRNFRSAVLALTFAVAGVAGPAQAEVTLRVEAQPVSQPVEAFVRVSDTNGDPVANLDSGDFTVTIDGVAIALAPADVTLPAAQGAQQVSVIFAMDYTSSVLNTHRDSMQDAVIAFIGEMNVGDRAAILKFNDDSGATVVQTFLAIDNGA